MARGRRRPAWGPSCWSTPWATPPSWPGGPWCARSRGRSSPWPRPRPTAAAARRRASSASSRAPGARPPTRWPARPRCCPCWPRPASSTPAARGTSSCSTPSCSCSTGGPCPSPRAWPPPDLAALDGWTVGANGGGTGAPGRTGRPRRQEHAVGDLRYEVMYLLDAPDDSIEAFKEVWAGIGDSIVVVGGDGLWNCHIHTNDVGAAIEAGVDAGRPRASGSPTSTSRSRRSAGCARTWAPPARARPSEGIGPPPTTSVVAVVVGRRHRAHLPLARRAPSGRRAARR